MHTRPSESRSLTAVSNDPGTGTQAFTYDGLNRVTGSTGLALARSYTYDLDGNRVTKVEGGVTFAYVFDRTDQQVSVIKTGGTTQTFAYDAYGNLTGDAETAAAVSAMTYDLGDKLTKIDPTGTTNDATFTFDALGRFRTRVLASSTDTYSYAGTSETVLRISNSSGPTVTDSIVSPAGDRLGINVGGTLNWLLPDLHGNVGASLKADETTITNATRYDAYGMTLATGSAVGAPAPVGEKNWKYQGRLDVSPVGLASPLYDMSARFYSPGLGAFTQFDSVMGSAQNPLSMNRFLYALANPATLIDPSGHDPCRFGGDDCGVKATHAATHKAARVARAKQTNVGRRLAPDEFEHGDHRTLRQIKAAGARVASEKANRDYDAHEKQKFATLGNAVESAPKSCEFICIDAHTALDFVGMIPLLGEPADLLNGAIYAAEGDGLNAAISWSSALPIAGNFIGAGKIIVKHGDEALDIAGAVASKGDEVAGLFGKQADEVADAVADVCKRSFSGDTRVATPSGDRPIAELEVGATVTARDPGSGEVAEHTVTAVHVNQDPEIEYLRIDGETIETTPDHLFLTDNGWVEAAALWPGTRVQRLDGAFGTVEGYSVEVRPVIMWDLTVSDVHTFAVGEGEWVVHNCDPHLFPSDRLEHTFDEHAEQWFGRPVGKSTHLDSWTELVQRGAQTNKSIPWSSGGADTFLHVSRQDGKNFAVQFFAGGTRSGQLATAFVPNQDQLEAMLRALGK